MKRYTSWFICRLSKIRSIQMVQITTAKCDRQQIVYFNHITFITTYYSILRDDKFFYVKFSAGF